MQEKWQKEERKGSDKKRDQEGKRNIYEKGGKG